MHIIRIITIVHINTDDTGDLYTVIDLGSNSFHMLTVAKVDNGFKVISKVKQPVRLASGIDKDLNLTPDCITNGLCCVQRFKSELTKLAPKKVFISATAAVRISKNRDVFLAEAEKILENKVHLLSGKDEAETIFKGACFANQLVDQILVIDIGGASTELIIGKNKKVKEANSLEMGCVSWNCKYFSDEKLNLSNFNNAINGATQILQPLLKVYKELSWEFALGNSGTIRAVLEINQAQGFGSDITLNNLETLQKQCVDCKNINELKIFGLKEKRVPVFASGLSILIAIFKNLDINRLQQSSGALREGLISILFNDDQSR